MRLADYVAKSFALSGVNRVFGLTGRGSIFLTDGMARSQEISFIPLLHEQSAGFAAEAATIMNGKVSVCMVSSGVGASNLVSSTLSAWQNQTPVLYVSGQNSSQFATGIQTSSIRTFGEQEFDVVGMVKKVTKFATILREPNQIENLLETAFREMTRGRPGPAWLDIPLDFQSARVSFAPKDFRNVSKLQAHKTFQINQFDTSSTVVIFGNSLLNLPRELLIEKLQRIHLPSVFEPGVADLKAHSTNSHGVLGTPGPSPSAVMAVKSAKTVILIGASLRVGLFGESGELFKTPEELIIFDYSAEWLPEALKSKARIYKCSETEDFADVLDILSQGTLTQPETQQTDKTRVGCPSADSDSLENRPGDVDLFDLIQAVSANLVGNEVVLTDSGSLAVISPSTLELRSTNRLLHPFSQGAMGWALGAAVGVLESDETCHVLILIGDGSMMMNIQELESLRRYRGRVTIIVVENDMYAIIRKRQSELFRGRTVGTDWRNGLTSPDLKKIAEAFGFIHRKLGSLSELESCLVNQGENLMIEVQGKLRQPYFEYGDFLQTSRENTGKN